MKNNLKKCKSCTTCKYVEKRTDFDCPFVNYFCFLENKEWANPGLWYKEHRVDETMVCSDWESK